MDQNDQNGTTTGGHDAHGRFALGNKKGRGRPPRDGKRYAAILAKALTPRRWRAIVERAIRDATEGDERVVHHARTFIANYCIGKPEQVLKLASEGDSRLRVEFVKDWTPGTVTDEALNADDSSPGPT